MKAPWLARFPVLPRILLAVVLLAAVVALAAWFAVWAAMSLDTRPYAFGRAYLVAFVIIGFLVGIFTLLGESMIEDLVKAGLFLLLAALMLVTGVPKLFPLGLALGAVLAFAVARVVK